jgi:hypothetical protein
MRANILAGVTLTIFLGVQAAYPQAAAESVLLNSNSATATVKAGTSLGNSLNRASGKLGNQVQQTVNHAAVQPSRSQQASGVNVKIERTPRTAAAPQPSATGNSLITSIQGGHIVRPSATSASSTAK